MVVKNIYIVHTYMYACICYMLPSRNQNPSQMLWYKIYRSSNSEAWEVQQMIVNVTGTF